ncbi:hypothetical protein, partial [Xenorhabdus santafensis]|uniref:hypothetical protein n=1 Tax=Xenorhabdus santafensis TaxID=2582833 RepID=UPI0029E80EE7
LKDEAYIKYSQYYVLKIIIFKTIRFKIYSEECDYLTVPEINIPEVQREFEFIQNELMKSKLMQDGFMYC